ncbi:MAG: hypothetical protein AAF497_20040, partial [Planctomycetota bacterium]
RFNPDTEEWTVYDLPDAENQIPYALNIDAKGFVWICGTGNDTLNRFDPKTERLVEFRLPTRVSYTREIEFDDDGNVWTSTSGPARHMERGFGQIIKLEINDVSSEGGIKLTGRRVKAQHLAKADQYEDPYKNSDMGELLRKIADTDLPDAYDPSKGRNPKESHEIHQGYVDRRMAQLSEEQRGRVGRLWQEQRRINKQMKNAGASFVRILEWVAKEAGLEKTSSIEKKTRIHRLQTHQRSLFDAFAYVNRIPTKPNEGESPEDLAGRIYGRLANQEGRVLVKLPDGFSLEAYHGFKTFLGSEGDAQVTNCVSCHALPDFSDSREHVTNADAPGTKTVALRNLRRTDSQIRETIQSKIDLGIKKKATAGLSVDPACGRMDIGSADIPSLIAFLKTLHDVDDDQFRKLILSAQVVDVTKPINTRAGIQGSVRYDGPRPERRRIALREKGGKLSDCHELHKEGLLGEELLVDDKMGIANVFVYVKKGHKIQNYAAPKQPAVLDQVGCMFRPRVQGIMVGQPLVMKNGDPVLHNVRSLSFRNRPFNIAQPADSPERSKVFRKREKAVMIQCDLHPWMRAWYFVMDHPWFAVTDEQGNFSIDGLEPGEYKLAAWHEELGEQTITVDTRQSATVSFSFRPVKSNIIEAKTAAPATVTLDNASAPSDSARKPRPFVRNWSPGDFATIESRLSDSRLKPSLATGRQVFDEAGCIKCHVRKGVGEKYGPDLTEVKKRFAGNKLVEQILNPSLEIHKDFQT